MTDPTDNVDDALPEYTGGPVDQPSSTSWSNGRIAALLFGVAALIAGVFFAVMAATGGGDGPEAAMDRLFDAIADEDALGALEALDPEEREAIQPGLTAMLEELERLGVVSPDLDLNDVAGVDFEFADLEYRTATLSDDLVAVTVVGGTVTTTADPGAVPAGPVFDGLELDAEEPVTETETIDEDDEMTIVTIRRGDSWYVSIGYSIAEGIRASAGFPFPDPAAGVVPEGAESPSAAAEELMTALTRLDFRRMIALMPPGEMDVLHHYAPVFLPGAEEIQADFARSGVTVSIDDLEMEERSDGDVTRIAITALSATVSGPDGSIGAVRFDGECTTFEGELGELFGAGNPFMMFGADGDNQICTSDLTEAGPFAFFTMPQTALTSFTTVEVDGAWYVSPTRSILDLIVQSLQLIEDDGIQRFIEEGFGAFFGMTGESSTVTGELSEAQLQQPPMPLMGGDGGSAQMEACYQAMDEWGRMSAELQESGGDPSSLPPFPPAECEG